MAGARIRRRRLDGAAGCRGDQRWWRSVPLGARRCGRSARPPCHNLAVGSSRGTPRQASRPLERHMASQASSRLALGEGALPRHQASLRTHETQVKSKTTIPLSGPQPCGAPLRVLLQKHLAISYIIRAPLSKILSQGCARVFIIQVKAKETRA